MVPPMDTLNSIERGSIRALFGALAAQMLWQLNSLKRKQIATR